MREAVVHIHPAGPLLALVGNPNCGKTALFNRLTGSRQKVANYAGVTVERKEGVFTSPAGRTVRILDLPGAYSLHSASLDEAITREVCMGQRPGEARCWLILAQSLQGESAFDERLACINKAIALEPNRAESHDLKAVL